MVLIIGGSSGPGDGLRDSDLYVPEIVRQAEHFDGVDDNEEWARVASELTGREFELVSKDAEPEGVDSSANFNKVGPASPASTLRLSSPGASSSSSSATSSPTPSGPPLPPAPQALPPPTSNEWALRL